MIFYSAFLTVLSVAFLISNRLQDQENLAQRLFYYIGGWGGTIFFSRLLLMTISGDEIDLISMLAVMSVVFFCIINRAKYIFKIKYENMRKHNAGLKDSQKYYNLIRFTSYGQVMIIIGLILILMIILIGIYNGRISLL